MATKATPRTRHPSSLASASSGSVSALPSVQDSGSCCPNTDADFVMDRHGVLSGTWAVPESDGASDR
jgi:hypothetical protein